MIPSSFPSIYFDLNADNPNFFDRIPLYFVYIILNYFVYSRLLKPQNS